MCVTNRIPTYVQKIVVLKYFARFAEKKNSTERRATFYRTKKIAMKGIFS